MYAEGHNGKRIHHDMNNTCFAKFIAMASELFNQINYEKAYRKNRLDAANWVLTHPESLEELLHYCFCEDQRLATKATWVLEFVFRENLESMYPFLEYIFNNLPKAKGDGQLRSFALLSELLTIQYYKKKDATLLPIFTSNHKEIMIECCFDWMITNQKVACQARAMLALFHLGTEINWVHPELATIITSKLPQGSAGYKNRGKKVLEMIHKHQKK